MVVGASPAWGQCVEERKLTAADAAADDFFGASVSVSGNTVVVGASRDDDPSGSNAGSAYVFVGIGGVWIPQQKLTASDAAAGDLFGVDVSVNGDTAVGGAVGNDDACPEDLNCNSGSAYVVVRSGGVWTQQQKLTASDAAVGDFFGGSVSVSGDTVVVGADSDDHAGFFSGSAYVFVRSGGVWTQQQKLTALDAAEFDFFGASVSVSGDTAVVGVSRDSSLGGTGLGSAYVFVRSGAVWTQQQKLTALDAAADDQFGFSVSVSGDTALVGAIFDDHAGSLSGSAYVFVRSGAVWTQQQKLTASDADADDRFGVSVSVSGDTALISAPGNDKAGTDSGSAYVFVRSAGVWTQGQKLTASDAAVGDGFGNSVSASGDTAVVGASRNDDAGSASGSAYVFECTTSLPDPPQVGDDTCQTTNADTGVPCSTNADCTPPAVCGLKSRYLAITPANIATAGNTPSTIQIRIASMPQFPSRVGEIWWAGDEGNVSDPPGGPLRGAQVQCSTNFDCAVGHACAQVWNTGVLYLYGTPIVPNAVYEVRMCDANGAVCSDPLLVATGKWGDVIRAFGGGSQPNFGDVSSIVAKFSNLASAPSMPRADLVGVGNPGQPSTPNQVANFADISNDVAVFSGFPYPFTVPACP